MSVSLAMRGIRGGSGVTSLVAALGHALARQQQRVLLVDLGPDNMLGLHYGLAADEAAGWARAELDGHDWRDCAFALDGGLAVLPCGRIAADEIGAVERLLHDRPRLWTRRAAALMDAGWDWVIFDIPQRLEAHAVPLPALDGCDLRLCVAPVDAAAHVLLQRDPRLAAGDERILANRYDPARRLQRDLMQLWIARHGARLVPQPVHEDEAVAEALAGKHPLGLDDAESRARADVEGLAIWCLARRGSIEAGGRAG